jgi:hypothetical protein
MAKGRSFRSSATILLPCCIGLTILALCMLGWLCCRKSSRARLDGYVSSTVGPLDPGVHVRDMGTAKSKCFNCEDQAGLDGSKPKCLTCTQPSFKYLTETIIAEKGAEANGACLSCRGAP